MTEPWYRRPKTRRKVTIIALVVLVFGLLFTFAPTYLVRYFVANMLDDFGIEAEGITTLKVNLWKREVWVGPVRFRAGDADPGQLGEFGVKIRVFPAFQKHAMVERVLVRGIDIVLVRDNENVLTLNGIPLNQFLPAAAPESQQAIEESEPWGTGLVDFDLQNSRLIFKEKTGGTLTVEVESLQLDNFTSWQPDDPGTIVLKARTNDITLDVTGQARPFANNVTIELDAVTRDLDLAKIIQFTGPLGLDRLAGVYESTLHHEITLFDTGRLEGHSVGKVTVSGADYARANTFAIATEQGNIDLDTRYSLDETRNLQVDGQLSMDLVKAGGILPGENTFAIGSARIVLADLSSSLGADKSVQVAVKPQIDLQQGSYSGRVQLSMDALLDVLRYLQSISTTQQVEQEQTGLEKWAGDEVTLPKSDISVATYRNHFSKFELDTSAGNVSLELATDLDAADIKVVATERSAHIDSVQSKFDSIQLHSGQGQMALQVTGNTAVLGYAMKGPLGEGSIKTVKLKENVELQINRGDIALQGSANAAVNGTDLVLYKTQTLAQADIDVGNLSADITKASFSLANKKMQWQVDAGTRIDNAAINFAKGKMASAKFGRLEVRGAKADHNLNIVTKALIISGLDGLVTRQFIDGLAGDKPADIAKKDKDITTPPSSAETIKPQLKLDQFSLAKGAQLRFRDDKVQPPVRVDLNIQRAELSNVDTRNPKQTARASLIAKINEFTNLALDGQATALGPKIDLTLTSKLENLELPPYSSYAAEFGGVYLERGQLNTNANVNARRGELDGAIKLNVKQLKFNPLSEADAKRLSASAGVPIDTAARLLQDRHGNINLTFPVAGTVVDPQVDISSAINKAIGNTLKTIFPPTLIASILASGIEGDGMTFEPIKFKPGSKELDKTAQDYLNELVTLLKERPRLSLNICGRTTPDDFVELTQISIKLSANPKPGVAEQRARLIDEHGAKLLDLATERTQVVQRYLINEKGLTVNQVGTCRPVFDPDDTGPPRVMVTL